MSVSIMTTNQLKAEVGPASEMLFILNVPQTMKNVQHNYGV